MYVKIWRDSGKTYLNDHEVMIRDTGYVLCGHVFKTMGAAAEYVAAKDKKQTPEEIQSKLSIIVIPEPEIPDEAIWLRTRDLQKQYDLTKAMVKALRAYWVENYPQDIRVHTPNSFYKDTPYLHKTVQQIEIEMRTRRPMNCPENFIDLKEAASKRGIKRNTLGTYINKGEIREKYLRIGKWTPTKYFLSPDWKWGK